MCRLGLHEVCLLTRRDPSPSHILGVTYSTWESRAWSFHFVDAAPVTRVSCVQRGRGGPGGERQSRPSLKTNGWLRSPHGARKAMNKPDPVDPSPNESCPRKKYDLNGTPPGYFAVPDALVDKNRTTAGEGRLSATLRNPLKAAFQLAAGQQALSLLIQSVNQF